MSAVRRVPASADLLDGAQYAVAFQLRTPIRATPEQWARAVFEGAPSGFRAVLRLGWRFALGLRLGPRGAAGYVEGWTITDNSPTAIVLAADSRLLAARNVFAVDGDTATWTTLVRYDNPLARVLWGLAAPVHQLTARPLFARALR